MSDLSTYKLEKTETSMIESVHKANQSRVSISHRKPNILMNPIKKTILAQINIPLSFILVYTRYKIVDSIIQARLIIPGLSPNTNARARVKSESGKANRISKVFLCSSFEDASVVFSFGRNLEPVIIA